MPIMIEIAVTRADIEVGCIRDSRNCAIAKAGSRALGVPVVVGTKSMDIRMEALGHWEMGHYGNKVNEHGRIALPDEAIAFIREYDSGSLLSWPDPITFSVEVPDEIVAELPHLALPLAVKEEKVWQPS